MTADKPDSLAAKNPYETLAHAAHLLTPERLDECVMETVDAVA